MFGRSVQGNEDYMKTEKDNTKVMIMGEEWDVKYVDPKDNILDEKNWGESVHSTKSIIIDSTFKECDRNRSGENMQKEITLHELIHAHLDVMGARNLSSNEDTVWIITRLIKPLIKNANKLDCLEWVKKHE